mmetsp:Transcript_127347/g.224231  ORF Transcript_127347/g.224231 Transcript_127347/m.224231 type:complete len:208 (+) Transcript_127347:98-721(+)
MGNNPPCVCNNAPCSADETKLGEQTLVEGNSKEASLKNPYKAVVVESDAKMSAEGGEDDTITYRDGASYSGQVLDGKRHGRGTFTSAAGEYVGQWEDDLRHGEGREAWKDGRLYTGTFRKGKINGTGRMEWRTPQGVLAYEGEYLDDLKHGQGKFSWPDGRIYDGQWEFGKRSGQATYVSSRGITRKGVWVNDKLQKWLDGLDTKSP